MFFIALITRESEMKTRRKAYWLAIIPFFLTGTLSAQDYKLQGEILTSDSEPIDGAVVVLQAVDSLVSTTLTNDRGQFDFGALPGRDYKIAISNLGYEPIEEHVTLNTNRKLSYKLYPITRIDLAEVEIVGDRSQVVKQLANGTTFYLSKESRDMNNPYLALHEIPKLIVDDADRTIRMNDGSVPLLLINGIRKEGGLDTVDPRDIESIEVIDFPSARYLSEGITSVVNIKLKRKRQPYQSFNMGTQQTIPIEWGSSNAFYEMGSSNYSVYATGSHFYFEKDKIAYLSEQRRDGYWKSMNENSEFTIQFFNATLGGDYVFSDKDYLSYGITYETYSTTSPSQGEGTITQGDANTSVELWAKKRTKYYINTYNLYHKHTFDKKKVLETTFRFNLNGHENTGSRREVYDNLPEYDYSFDYDNFRRSMSLDVNYGASWKEQSFNLGSRTNFTNDRIGQNEFPDFRYKEWKEYLYADISGQPEGSFSYLASVGIDMIFNNSQNVHNRYVRPKSSLSLNYSINSSQAVSLSYRLDNESPNIRSLNPYNTSSDSLYRTEGNPYLVPNQKNRFSLDYSFNKSGIYLAPSFSYVLTKNNIVQAGYMDDKVYVQTYVNEGRNSMWTGNITYRYRSGKWGTFGGNSGYTRYYFSEFDKGSFYTNFDLSLYYKKIWLTAYVGYQRYYYTPTSTFRSHVPDSQTRLGWRVNDKLTLTAGMRYFLGGLKTENITNDGEYYSRSVQTNVDRKYLFNIGFTYYWRNKTDSPQRNKKQLYQQEQGISL